MRSTMLLYRWLGRAMFVPAAFFVLCGSGVIAAPFFLLGALWTVESRRERKAMAS